jgi:hypothetical protein
MHWSEIQFRPSDKTLRQFAGICIVFFGGIGAYQGYFHGRTTGPLVLEILAAVGVLGTVWPRLIRPIYVGWMVAAFPIGWVVSHVILAVIFYGLFTPLAAFFRLMGRDALHRRRRPDLDSYFVAKTTPADPASYLRQY